MSQSDLNVANAAGATVRSDINSHLEALGTLSSGASAPTTTFANMWWFDTTNNLLKIRDNANTTWITVAEKNGSVWYPYINGQKLSTTAALDELGLALVSQAEAEAGVATTARRWTAERVGQAIAALSGGSSGVPVGTVVDWSALTAPSGWLLCYGQAISRTTYSELNALYSADSYPWGSGNGSTTFNVPDFRGRVAAGQDDMGGSSANRLTGLSGGVNGDTFAAAGGAESHTLTAAEMPAHTHTVPVLTGGAGIGPERNNVGNASSPITTSSAGSGGAHNNVQPTLIINKIVFTNV